MDGPEHEGYRSPVYHNKWAIVVYHGFPIPKHNLHQCAKQIRAIKAMTSVQRQFVGTMIDTEVAVGYFLRKGKSSDYDCWVDYIAVKMKYAGDLSHLAELICRLPPSSGWYANTIKKSLDRRWSLSIQGVVAYALSREVRPFLYNEKAMVEVDCILAHGPYASANLPHPFTLCGARNVRRGVWYWPQIDKENENQRARSG